MQRGIFSAISTFLKGFKNSGITTAIVSPGSRNAPLIRGLDVLGFEMLSMVDERSAAFMALGVAKAQSRPVILCCTSGTAGLNYYPAIAEAYYSRVPIVVLTADRPPEDIDQWEGQSIRQVKVFSNHIRQEINVDFYLGDIDPTATAGRIISIMSQSIPGPVHVNIPLREPLYRFEEIASDPEFSLESPQTNGYNISVGQIARFIGEDWSRSKVLCFQGADMGEDVRLYPEGEPFLTDVTALQRGNIELWDTTMLQLRDDRSRLEALRPEILITLGGTTLSKGLKQFLRAFPPKAQYHISSFDEVGKMFGVQPKVIHPEKIVSAIPEDKGMTSYQQLWRSLQDQTKRMMDGFKWSDFNEFSALKAMLDAIPETSVIHSSNSMPVRYLSFLGGRRVYANRGTSGIDGCTSTAVGYAKYSSRANFLFTGDLAFLYDINALWQMSLPENLKIVVLNNQGGGIFELIDGPQHMLTSAIYQTTNHQRDLQSLANHWGIHYFCATDFRTFNNSLRPFLDFKGMAIFEFKTNRECNRLFFNQFKHQTYDDTEVGNH